MRTEAELRRLLAAADFYLTCIILAQAATEDSIIEGVHSALVSPITPKKRHLFGPGTEQWSEAVRRYCRPFHDA